MKRAAMSFTSLFTAVHSKLRRLWLSNKSGLCTQAVPEMAESRERGRGLCVVIEEGVVVVIVTFV